MNVILEGIVGSHAYGLNRAGSDIDHLGIFAYPTDAFWQLGAPTETITHSGPEYEIDRTFHEVGKYLRLALQCNPTILELLWLPQDLIVHTEFEGSALRDIRDAFLCERRVRDAYGGYAVQQAERLRKRYEEGKNGFSADTQNRTAKHARHCFRLLQQGRQLLETGELFIRIEDPTPYWAFDDMGVPEIYERFVEEFADFAQAPSVLADQADVEVVHDYIYFVRRRLLP